jgi:hypothetical protein
MAVVAKLFNQFPTNSYGGGTAGESSTLDWYSDTVVCLLLTAAYTPNRATHEFVSDVVAQEATTVTNYARQTLTGNAIAFNSGTRVNTFDANDVTFTNLTGSAKYAVFARNSGSDATSALICYVDLDDTSGAAVVSPAGQNLVVQLPATGLFTSTPAA